MSIFLLFAKGNSSLSETASSWFKLCSILTFFLVFLALFPNKINTRLLFSKALKLRFVLLSGNKPPALVSILISLKKSLLKLFSSSIIWSPESSLGWITFSCSSIGSSCFFDMFDKLVFQSAKRYIRELSSNFGGLAKVCIEGRFDIFAKGLPKHP